jgi:hypothetical protein
MEWPDPWEFSVENLRPFLHQHLAETYADGWQTIEYVRRITSSESGQPRGAYGSLVQMRVFGNPREWSSRVCLLWSYIMELY